MSLNAPESVDVVDAQLHRVRALIANRQARIEALDSLLIREGMYALSVAAEMILEGKNPLPEGALEAGGYQSAVDVEFAYGPTLFGGFHFRVRHRDAPDVSYAYSMGFPLSEG